MIPFTINHLFTHSLMFLILLCMINNSIKPQSFVYILLNDQAVLFQTLQFSMSTKLNSSKYCYVSLKIQSNIRNLFTPC